MTLYLEPSPPTLVEAAAPEVVGNDHIRHGVEDELDVLGVGGAGHVAVDLLGGRLVLGLELGLDVGGRLAVLLGTWVGEGLSNRLILDVCFNIF